MNLSLVDNVRSRADVVLFEYILAINLAADLVDFKYSSNKPSSKIILAVSSVPKLTLDKCLVAKTLYISVFKFGFRICYIFLNQIHILTKR